MQPDTYPCQVIISTTPYDNQFAVVGFMLSLLRFARGCGNALVALQGILNMMCTGMPSASAQWTCAKDGGFAMMAFATNGSPVKGSGQKQLSQQPSIISLIILRFKPTSPRFMDSIVGMRPGFRTMYYQIHSQKREVAQGRTVYSPTSNPPDHLLWDKTQAPISAQSRQKCCVLRGEHGGRLFASLYRMR